MALPWQRKLLRDTSVGQAPGTGPKHICYCVTAAEAGMFAWGDSGRVCEGDTVGKKKLRQEKETVKSDMQ